MTTNILILGGGYSGVMAALRLAGRTRRTDAVITLINAHDHFVERPRLHEAATGVALRQRPLAQMLAGSKVRFVQGRALAIDLAANCVTIETANGKQHLAYSYLINALGSRVNRTAIPGVQEHAFTLDPDGALTTAALRQRLEALADQPARVVVVGGGATGIEAAAQIKHSQPHSQVTLVTQGQVGAFKGPRVQQHLVGALVEQQVTLHEHANVRAVRADGVELEADFLPADVVIWAGGFVASPLARVAGLRVNSLGQTLVDPYLRALSHPHIYAVGDAACPVEEPGAPMRMSLFTALVSGAQAAENVAAAIHGKNPQPLSYVWYGQGIALGPHDAVGFNTFPVDAARGPIFRRLLAVRIRNFFVWYLSFALELERRFPGAFYWNGKGRYARQHRGQATAISALKG
ncbi:MAG: FAD-dependent oxidoreductase [Caldilineaceae bacterium]